MFFPNTYLLAESNKYAVGPHFLAFFEIADFFVIPNRSHLHLLPYPEDRGRQRRPYLQVKSKVHWIDAIYERPMTLRCNTHFWPWLVRPRGGRKVHNIIFPPDIAENGHYCWEMRALLGWNVLVQNWNEPLPCPLWRLTYHSKNYWKLSLVFSCQERTKDILSKEVGFMDKIVNT